ncbi:MAG: DUF2183 domain-containing protein [Propionibacteriaceae bacterium]|nr:DUF2183 domain-containing protein [Propionibacteriaceae bacterium]
MTADLTLITTLLQGHTDRDEEAQVLDLVRTASAESLDQLLREVDAADLFHSLDDRVFGPRHRTALRALLVERIGELSIAAQANLAYGLQAGHTDRADEEAIRRVFLARRGQELTQLKNAINSRTDAHDLEGLVFGDVDDEGIRQDILDHIATEAATLDFRETKVLCDIDDTVVCALHDGRYPRGTIYPGILALLDALDRGPRDEPFSLGDLTFVTARPSDAFGLIENHTRTTLRNAGIATHSMLTGTFAALVTHDLMANQKLANIEHYRLLFPEYRKMFIGDSGQGDIKVGQLIWERFPDAVDAVVIHDVVGKPADERAALDAEGIHLVDTYVGAANHLHGLGLISEAGRQRVIDESRAALDTIAWRDDAQRDVVTALIERDASAT